MTRSKAAKFIHLHFNGVSPCKLLPFSSPSLLHLLPNFSFPFFELPFLFSRRYYASHNVDDPQLFLKSVREQCELGFTNIDHAVSLFNDMRSVHPLPHIIDFNRLLSAMCKIKPFPPFSSVISLYRQLLLLGIRPDKYSLNIMTNCYCCFGLVDLGPILSPLIVSSMVSFTLTTWTGAVRLLDKVVKLGLNPDIYTYGTMFKGLCRTRNHTGALKLLRKMESYGHCMPNVVIYNTIIDCLCKDNLLAKALNLFSEMKTKGIPPDVVTYTTLIRGMYILGQQRDAHQMLTEMLDNNIHPDVETYNTLIDMYCKEAEVSKARAIFDLMHKKGVYPNVITYNTLLDGYCLCGQMDEAKNLLDLMINDGCKPNIVKHRHYLIPCPKEDWFPDVITYSALLDGYCLRGELHEAEKLLDQMVKGGYKPNVVTFSSLINGYCKSRKIDKALTLLHEMPLKGLTPNVVTYTTVIDALCKDNSSTVLPSF
ncbi:hypothetical protein RDABS01_029575 [Bienertia sinuspersici]